MSGKLLSDEQLQAIKTNAELDGYMYWTNCQKVFSHIEEMQQREATLVEALELYAEVDNYILRQVAPYPNYQTSDAEQDTGKRARVALAAVKEGSE